MLELETVAVINTPGKRQTRKSVPAVRKRRVGGLLELSGYFGDSASLVWGVLREGGEDIAGTLH